MTFTLKWWTWKYERFIIKECFLDLVIWSWMTLVWYLTLTCRNVHDFAWPSYFFRTFWSIYTWPWHWKQSMNYFDLEAFKAYSSCLCQWCVNILMTLKQISWMTLNIYKWPWQLQYDKALNNHSFMSLCYVRQMINM